VTPGSRALRALVDVLNGAPADDLVPLLAPRIRTMVDGGAVADLGEKLRPVRVERTANTFEHRLDALLETSDGLRLCMIGTEDVEPHLVAFLDLRPIAGEPWMPNGGDRFVDRMRNDLQLVGLVTAVVDGDDIVYESVGGVDEHSVFRVGSVSKPITALGVRQCVDDGLFSLDDPLDALLPDVDVPAGVTVRLVVDHRSGLESDAPLEAVGEVPTIPALLDVAPLRLGFQPGTQHAYSNVGYGLLGHLIATARGEPFEDVMRDRIFRPLGMDDTGYVLSHTDETRLATGSQSILGLVSPVPWPEVTVPGAGSVFSTAVDLARLARSWLVGERVLHRGAWDGYTAAMLLEPARHRAAVALTNTDAITTTGGVFDVCVTGLLDSISSGRRANVD
jgi:CubicO group peptidase (beta-lactamase class C family)